MMAPPTVSVIIPTYNRAHYLGAAIESVLAQTYRDFELIVIDDGSTDATLAMMQQVQDHRVRSLRQSHQGISAAMNAGLRSARGAYLARLDSDDLWLPEMLACTVEVLDARPDVGLVYGRAQVMTADGELEPGLFGFPMRYPDDSFRSMLYNDCTCSITIVVRRECVERVGPFDESLATGEDWDMWLRVAEHDQFAYVDQVVAWHRWHTDNITGHQSPYFADALDGRAKVLDKLFQRRDLPPRIMAMKSTAYRNVYTEAVLRWWEAGAYHQALGAFWKALCTGGNPVATLTRLMWFSLVWRLLNHYDWGRRLVVWLAGRRRCWRGQNQGTDTGVEIKP